MDRPRTNEEWLPTWLFILVLPFLWLEACLHAFDSAARAFAESVRRGTPWVDRRR
jgi:hypothetical protein